MTMIKIVYFIGRFARAAVTAVGPRASDISKACRAGQGRAANSCLNILD